VLLQLPDGSLQCVTPALAVQPVAQVLHADAATQQVGSFVGQGCAPRQCRFAGFRR
jgi:hypothetical protein